MKLFVVLAIAAFIIVGAWWYARRRVDAASTPEPVAEPEGPTVDSKAAGGRIR